MIPLKALTLTLLLTFIPIQSDVEVPVIKETGSGSWCTVRLKERGPLINKEQFDEMMSSEAAKDCPVLDTMKIDFEKQSLLTYRVNGDCFVRANAKLTRNDELKKYTLRVTRTFGGCRAAGSFQGWMVFEKLRSDYKLETELTTLDEQGRPRNN